MFDVLTFGSATLDIFLVPDKAFLKKEKRFRTGQGLCFPFSSKVDVRDVFYKTGGGGTNTAATFSNMGLRVSYCGVVGADFAGEEVLKDLERFKVDTSLVFKRKEVATNLSLILSFKKDRTALVWREASEAVVEEKLPWKDFKTRWLYLAPLSGKARRIFKPLVGFAEEQGIKIFANPGNSQIDLGGKDLKPILGKVDVLLLNQEEASRLTGVTFKKEKKVFKKLDEIIPGLAVMTKGGKGVVASDGNHLWRAPSLAAPVVEKTGAGDAFGSGLLTGLIKEGSVSYGLQLGVANASYCIGKVGAKEGLLKEGSRWEKVKVEKVKL